MAVPEENTLLRHGGKWKKVRLICSIVILVLALLVYLFSVLQGNQASSVPVQKDSGININDFTVMENGNRIYATAQNKVTAYDGENLLWEYATDNAVVSVYANGDYIYIGCNDRTIQKLDASGKLLSKATLNYPPVAVAGSADGSIMAVSTHINQKSYFYLFDGEGNELKKESIPVQASEITVNQDGSKIVYATGDSQVVLLDKTGKELKLVDLIHQPQGLATDVENELFAITDISGNTYLYDFDLNQKFQLNYNYRASDIAINAKTKTIAVVAQLDKRLWMLDYSGNELANTSLTQEITNLEFSADGKELLTLDYENNLSLYNAGLIGNAGLLRVLRIVSLIVSIVSMIVLVLTAVFYKNGMPRKAKDLLKEIVKCKWSYIVMLPSLALLAVFNYFPAIYAFILAFCEYKPGVYMRFVGFANFVEVFHDKYFWSGCLNSLIFLVADLLKSLIPPLLFAELILAIKSKRLQYGVRVALYLPGVLPGVAGLLIWTDGILGSDGIISQLIRWIINNPDYVFPGLGDARTALPSLIFIGFPWVGSYLIFYGALMGINPSMYEAARLDGCRFFTRIAKIDIPMILPQIKYIFVTTFIGSLQNFGTIYMTTLGGPGHATYTPALEMYFNMTQFQNYGVAAAMGLLLFAVIFGATLINLRMNTQVD